MTVHSSPAPDWKVTTGYRVVVRIGWCLTALAVYLGAAASVVGSDRVWWIVAGLAVTAILMGMLLPEPVPRDMITGHRTQVDPTAKR